MSAERYVKLVNITMAAPPDLAWARRTTRRGRRTMAKPIVAMSFNAARFDGYNLTLRLRHAGYTNVYWYRGGREAWEVAGMPEDVVGPVPPAVSGTPD